MNMRYMMSQETPSHAERGSASARGLDASLRSLHSSSTSPGSDSESSSSDEIGSKRLQQEVPTSWCLTRSMSLLASEFMELVISLNSRSSSWIRWIVVVGLML